MRSVTSALLNKTSMQHRFDQGVADRAAIGVIALATDATIEWEWRRLLTLDGVGFFVSRIMNAPTVTPENLKGMEKDLEDSTALILPGFDLDVVAYGCTSASMLIGEEVVARHIRSVRADVQCTMPIAAAKAAIKALGLRRIALLTPYIEEINQAMRNHFEAADIPVPVMGSFNNINDIQVSRIRPDSIREAALELGRESGVDGVFISCTNLRAAALVEPLEQELGKPVTSSNHAMAWHALRLAGVDEAVPEQGRLFMI